MHTAVKIKATIMNPKDIRTFGYPRLSISGFKASVMDVVEFGLIMRIDIVAMISEVHVEQRVETCGAAYGSGGLSVTRGMSK